MGKWKYIFGLLILVATAVWLAVIFVPDGNFHLIACDVGEGDAILATYKNFQVLTDGGANNKVLDCLSRHMPYWDRTIELVILTHPDSDHYRGLIEVFRRYKIDNYLYNDLTISSQDYQVLEKEVGGEGARLYQAGASLKLRAGKIYLDILYPKEIIQNKTNENSIIALVSFANFKALLTGDMVPGVSDTLSENWLYGAVNYIKVPHHGSKNGLTEKLIAVLRPEFAVISVGKNSYGHPDLGILELLKKYNAKIFRTDEIGDVEFTVKDSGNNL